jgi:hypothetical protein
MGCSNHSRCAHAEESGHLRSRITHLPHGQLIEQSPRPGYLLLPAAGAQLPLLQPRPCSDFSGQRLKIKDFKAGDSEPRQARLDVTNVWQHIMTRGIVGQRVCQLSLVCLVGLVEGVESVGRDEIRGTGRREVSINKPESPPASRKTPKLSLCAVAAGSSATHCTAASQKPSAQDSCFKLYWKPMSPSATYSLSGGKSKRIRL